MKLIDFMVSNEKNIQDVNDETTDENAVLIRSLTSKSGRCVFFSLRTSTNSPLILRCGKKEGRKQAALTPPAPRSDTKTSHVVSTGLKPLPPGRACVFAGHAFLSEGVRMTYWRLGVHCAEDDAKLQSWCDQIPDWSEEKAEEEVTNE